MNVKRNLLATFLVSTVMGVGTGAASAVEYSWLLKQGFYGSQAQSKPDITVRISGTTEDIFVDHFTTVKFENAKGQSFAWRFDSEMEMSNFFLKTIAPSAFDAGNARVIINHPLEHRDGG